MSRLSASELVSSALRVACVQSINARSPDNGNPAREYCESASNRLGFGHRNQIVFGEGRPLKSSNVPLRIHTLFE